MLARRNSVDPQPTRLSIVGTRAAGKSTCIGLLNLTAMDMGNKSTKGAVSRGLHLQNVQIRELNSMIREVVGNLNHGIFPQPTPTNNTFNSSLVLEFGRRRMGFGPSVSSVAELNITDVAGETMTALMSNFEQGDFQLQDSEEINEINKFILSASAFVVIVDTEELVNAAMPTSGGNNQPSNSQQDVELARFVDSLIRYKENNRRSPGIHSVALMGTKYDRVRNTLGGRSFNDYGDLNSDQLGKDKFMDNFLPQTWLALDNLVEDKSRLRIFYSEIEMARNVDGEEPRIEREEGRLRPKYSIEEYERLISWIGELAR